VAEGAGAASVAAALSGEAGHGRIVCVVSGGNIDPLKLAAILRGETP
jgi:threonine dehydratase